MEGEKFGIQEKSENHKKGSLILPIILATGLATACALSKPKPETTPVRTYTSPKKQEIVKVRRSLYLCSSEENDLKKLLLQCQANIKKYKEAGLPCVSCDREVEVQK